MDLKHFSQNVIEENLMSRDKRSSVELDPDRIEGFGNPEV